MLRYIASTEEPNLQQMSRSASSARGRRNKTEAKTGEQEKESYERKRAQKEEREPWAYVDEDKRSPGAAERAGKNVVRGGKKTWFPEGARMSTRFMTNSIFPSTPSTQRAICSFESRTALALSNTGCSAHSASPDVAPLT